MASQDRTRRVAHAPEHQYSGPFASLGSGKAQAALRNDGKCRRAAGAPGNPDCTGTFNPGDVGRGVARSSEPGVGVSEAQKLDASRHCDLYLLAVVYFAGLILRLRL